jgi:hypothetical protein
MIHCFDLLPLGTDGRVRACWLDRPVAAVVLACTCGWFGEVLGLSREELDSFYGEPSTEEEFETLHDRWEALHAEALVPAVVDLEDGACLRSGAEPRARHQAALVSG